MVCGTARSTRHVQMINGLYNFKIITGKDILSHFQRSSLVCSDNPLAVPAGNWEYKMEWCLVT